VAGLMTFSSRAFAQDPAPPPVQTPVSSQTQTNGNVTTTTTTTTDANGKPVQSVSTTVQFPQRGKKKPAPDKDEKVVESKDTKKAVKSQHKVESLAGVDAKLPDKQLFDKAVTAMNKGHFDVARLDLQTMLNTYPDSQYQMRAKLAIADSWYKEGGTAALTQAESEYADFRVFFPNAPEAAEAQMRIGDIYFRQMDRPDRDYAKALSAEAEYRRMLTDYPDSILVPQAKQRLRDVQEVLATREADIAAYYASKDNYAAEIARFQTVADTYPLYSHMDDVLVGLGDAYQAQSRYMRSLNLPEGPKARLVQYYDEQAAASYRKVVLEHAAAPHVDDAKDRLAAMNLPIPTPTAAQLAASVELENSRGSYHLTDNVRLFFLHTPDTVVAAHSGDPTLTDPKATVAPAVVKRANDEFRKALLPDAGTPAAPATAASAAPAAAPADATPAPAAAPLSFGEVPTAGSSSSPSTSVMTASPTGTPASGTSVGVEIINPKSTPATTTPPNPSPDAIVKPVGPTNTTNLPAVEKAADAPDTPNTINGTTNAAGTPNANGKNAATPVDKQDESSSKKKKKTGLKKLIPPV